jgi:site-specific DNA-methyltransferase (adenine-specific)
MEFKTEGISMLTLLEGDNLELMKELGKFHLIYFDPPFNTGKTQSLHAGAYTDQYENYEAFLKPRLQAAYEHLTEEGSFFLHLDKNEVHYAKVWCDGIWGRNCFQNEIIWVYDFGGRSKKRYAAKHDTILWYTKHPTRYTFEYQHLDRIPYMAPGFVGAEKAAKGKCITDCWWQTIVPTMGKERTGYPTQKPLLLMQRLVNIHTQPGDRVLDAFAGSGTMGEACWKNQRECVLIDQNPEAHQVMQKRFQCLET